MPSELRSTNRHQRRSVWPLLLPSFPPGRAENLAHAGCDRTTSRRHRDRLAAPTPNLSLVRRLVPTYVSNPRAISRATLVLWLAGLLPGPAFAGRCGILPTRTVLLHVGPHHRIVVIIPILRPEPGQVGNQFV